MIKTIPHVFVSSRRRTEGKEREREREREREEVNYIYNHYYYTVARHNLQNKSLSLYLSIFIIYILIYHLYSSLPILSIHPSILPSFLPLLLCTVHLFYLLFPMSYFHQFLHVSLQCFNLYLSDSNIYSITQDYNLLRHQSLRQDVLYI